MKQHDVGSVPVVESDKRLVGIVTDRDIVVKVVAAGRNPEQTPVKEAMTPNPVSCKEDDDLDYALKLMKERQVRRMPIVDGSGRLTGIIAQADVATRVNKDAQDRRACRSHLRIRDDAPLRRVVSSPAFVGYAAVGYSRSAWHSSYQPTIARRDSSTSSIACWTRGW